MIQSCPIIMENQADKTEIPAKSFNIEMVEKIHKLETYETSLCFNLIGILKGVFVLPLIAFFSCIILSLTLHFESTTNTHCNVPNYLPSVSAAIGTFELQKFIWQYLIALHTPPRLFVAFMFRSYFKTFSSAASNRDVIFMINAITIADLVENLSLLLLTIVSSRDNYYYHEKAFLTFVLTSQIHMIVKIVLLRKLKADPEFSGVMQKSLKLKTWLWLINITCIVCSAYFFVRHNTYCEAGVYTLFAMCEYTIVLTNIAYHGTGFLEFANTTMTVEVGARNKTKSKPS